MNILYIITQADGGGAQKYVLSLAKYFKGIIAAGDEAAKLFDDAKAAGLKTFTLKHLKRNINLWHDFWAVWEIRELIKNLRPDIVHLNSTKAGVLGSCATIGLKTKTIFTAHGFRFLEPLSFPARMFYLALEKVVSSYRDFIITVSDADRESALKNKLIDENKIKTIHNGIPKIDFLPCEEARKKLGLPPHPSPSPSGRGIKGEGEKFIFGTIANFYKTKGLDVLVDAVAMLHDDMKARCLFVIIGDGSHPPYPPLMKGGNKRGGKGLPIQFLGKINDASKYLKAFNCFILPSRKEGFPFVLLEAMQGGLPIIASRVGGVPEALGDTGILVPAEDKKALADKIGTILLYSNIIRTLSQKALERSKLFTEEKMLEETKKVYKKVLQKWSPTAKAVVPSIPAFAKATAGLSA